MADEPRDLERSERFERYLDALLGGGRPTPDGVADADEAEMARLAAELAAVTPAGSRDPDPAFVEQLRLRMRAADEGIAAVQVPPPLRPAVEPAGTMRWRLSRRRLLQAGVGAAGVAAGAAGGFLLREALQDDGSGWRDADLVGGDGVWTEVASVSELPDGSVLAFATPAFSGFVVNDGGEIRALSSACTHLGCTLQHRPEYHDLRCPCHPASFNLRGWLANGEREWREAGPYPDDAEPYPVELPPLARPKVKLDAGRILVWTARV